MNFSCTCYLYLQLYTSCSCTYSCTCSVHTTILQNCETTSYYCTTTSISLRVWSQNLPGDGVQNQICPHPVVGYHGLINQGPPGGSPGLSNSKFPFSNVPVSVYVLDVVQQYQQVTAQLCMLFPSSFNFIFSKFLQSSTVELECVLNSESRFLLVVEIHFVSP